MYNDKVKNLFGFDPVHSTKKTGTQFLNRIPASP